jgi:hypothetical protein
LNRLIAIAALALAVLGAGAVALVGWVTREDAPAGTASASAQAPAASRGELAPAAPAAPPQSLGDTERAAPERAAELAFEPAAPPGGAPEPDGEKVLAALEQAILASEVARRCVAEGEELAAKLQLTLDSTGVTYRLDPPVEPAVGHCLMTEALPDVLATVSAPRGVQRAERDVRIPAF